MYLVAPLSNFATLVQMLNVNFKFHLHLPATILYFFLYSSPQANDFRTGYNYLCAMSTKTTAINNHSVPSIFTVQSLLSVIMVTNATQLLSKSLQLP